MSEQPLGFSSDRILLLDTVAQNAQPAVAWEQMVDHLKAVPGVETTAMASWGLVNEQARTI